MFSKVDSSSFRQKKAHILASLTQPEDQYSDLSPKGSVDEGIRHLIDLINNMDGCVTTSSCAGRISVFLEGRKNPTQSRPNPEITPTKLSSVGEKKHLLDHASAGSHQYNDGNPQPSDTSLWSSYDSYFGRNVGGKGNGGHWLFVSHSPVPLPVFEIPSRKWHRQEKQKSCIEVLGMEDLQILLTAEGNDQELADRSDSPKKPSLHEDVFDNKKSDHTNVVTATATSFPIVELPKLFYQPKLIKTFRMIRLKFEPMILHILTASHAQADNILLAAIQTGFRESGAVNLHRRRRKTVNQKPRNCETIALGGEEMAPEERKIKIPGAESNLPSMPMVAVRSHGLAFESIVGLEWNNRNVCLLPEWQMRGILLLANQRFEDNTKRIKRFSDFLSENQDTLSHQLKTSVETTWEDPISRKTRKRQEGLEKSRLKAEFLEKMNSGMLSK